MIRQMRNTFEGALFYESAFNMETGHLVRSCFEGELPRSLPSNLDEPRYTGPQWHDKGLSKEEVDRRRELFYAWREGHPGREDRWRKLYKWNRRQAFSPVPETIDVKITNRCGFGCPTCYQDSKPRVKHTDGRLIETIFEGLDIAPYQIAIGGGEPTLHPDLPGFLKYIREKGTVPNYTTAGYKWSPEVIDATNKYCGGVALSYHPHQGMGYFAKTFRKWHEALSVQLNVHVIADKNGAQALNDLLGLFDEDPELHPKMLNIVLLAYHPTMGRAQMEGVMPRSVYMAEFPNQIRRMKDAGAKVAFSEGLLPFFFSRPELDMGTEYATAMEGLYSCYVSDKGTVHLSSFEDPRHRQDNIFETRFQDIWNKGFWRNHAGGTSCYDCHYEERCAPGHYTHMLMCAWDPINRPKTSPRLSARALADQAFWAEVHANAKEN